MCQAESYALDYISTAPNCASADGNWVDVYGQWLIVNHEKTTEHGNEIHGHAYLTANVAGVVKDCGIGELSGTQDDSGMITFTIDNDSESTGCADISTIKLKPDSKGNLDGWWINSTGGVGGYLYFDRKPQVR